MKCTKSPPRVQSNPRYRHFTQDEYTIGDEDQWHDSVFGTEGQIPRLAPSGDVVVSPEVSLPKDVGSVTPTSTNRTFRYLFHNLKKGIYVRIRQGKLESFIPFSKHGYTNAWCEKIRPSPPFPSINSVVKASQSACGRYFDERRVCRDRRNWVSNGHLVRFEYPLREGDTNVQCLRNFFETLCAERDLEDVEIFLNRRDFPLLRKDGSHPYKPYSKFPLQHFGPHTSYTPILSMCSSSGYLDIPFPTYEDWGRVSYQYDGSVFGSSYTARRQRVYPEIEQNKQWRDKIDKVVFRGSSTGGGTSKETNKRVRLAFLSLEHPDCLDCKLTDWNTRPRLVEREGGYFLDTLDPSDFELELSPFMGSQEQSEYRYVINLDGHSRAFRLSYEMGFRCLMLIVESDYDMWYSHLIEPFVHYVPVKEDLSDLISKVEWCRANPDDCEKIVQNCYDFYIKNLSREGVLNYAGGVLDGLAQRRGEMTTNHISPSRILLTRERTVVKGFTFNGNLVETCLLKKSKNSVVVANTGGLVSKEALISRKETELIHEVFVSFVLSKSNPLCKDQVSCCKGLQDMRSIWPYHKGKNLLERLKLSVRPIEYQDILHQVCGVLQSLQEATKFVHNDLYPWNIILEPYSGSTIKYASSRGVWSSLGTGYKLVLVDYGKSHVMYQNCQHGMVLPFSFSTIRDVAMFLVSSIDQIVTRYIESELLKMLLYCMNFASPEKKFRTKSDIRRYTRNAKKYTEAVYMERRDIELLEPADFIAYLTRRFPQQVDITPSSFKNQLTLPDDTFDDPQNVLAECRKGTHLKNSTFKKVATVLSRVNLEHEPENETFREIGKFF